MQVYLKATNVDVDLQLQTKISLITYLNIKVKQAIKKFKVFTVLKVPKVFVLSNNDTSLFFKLMLVYGLFVIFCLVFESCYIFLTLQAIVN